MTVGYNIFRWYRPGWGRYTQSDPLFHEMALVGLAEIHAYRYALGNPLTVIDALGLAPNMKYPTLNAAASDAVSDICSLSRSQDVEYFGYMYRAKDGSFFYSRPQRGFAHGAPIDRNLMMATAVVGLYHTHGDYSKNYDDNNFGPGDKRAARIARKPVFLVTPGGVIKRHDPDLQDYGAPGNDSVIGQCECEK